MLIILFLIYINRSKVLKFCQQKSLDPNDQATKPSTDPLTFLTSPPTLSANSHSPQKGFDKPTFAPDQRHVLALVLAICTYKIWCSHTNNNFVLKWSHSMLSLD